MSFDGFGSDLASRVTPFNKHKVDGSAPDGKPAYVLCWLQQALRAHDNPTIDAAIEIGNALGLPVVVYHGLRQDYPHASDRLHRFILGASRDVERGCEARGLRAATYVETPDHREKGLLYRLASRAAAVVTDEQFCFVARWQLESFAASHPGSVLAVDAARLVPTRTLPDDIRGTSGFRKRSGERRDMHVAEAFDFEPRVARFDGDLGFREAHNSAASDEDLDALVSSCAIDHTLPPGAFEASREAATARLADFVANDLPRYADDRNNPAREDSVSCLSPYLHFGVLGPREIVRAVDAAEGKRNPRWKFLDELLTWREWFHYLIHQADVPESFEEVPQKARASLLAHADDERPHLYTLSELLHGETHDETWNAAQRQWLATGYMHNNLRMYWSKKLIEWTPHPHDGWVTALYINDRLSIDGRDPSTYGNMQATFGRSKPAYREQEVYGWVAPKTDGALRKRPDVPQWLADWARSDVPRISVPNAAFVATGFETRLMAGEG